MKLIHLIYKFMEVLIVIIKIEKILIMDMDGSLKKKKNVFIILEIMEDSKFLLQDILRKKH